MSLKIDFPNGIPVATRRITESLLSEEARTGWSGIRSRILQQVQVLRVWTLARDGQISIYGSYL